MMYPYPGALISIFRSVSWVVECFGKGGRIVEGAWFATEGGGWWVLMAVSGLIPVCPRDAH